MLTSGDKREPVNRTTSEVAATSPPLQRQTDLKY